MKNVMVGFLLWMCAGAAWPQCGPLVPYVRQVDYVVETVADGNSTRETQSLYVLYVGNPETERLDGLAERVGVARSVCLVHPVPEDAGAHDHPGVFTRPAGSGWYVTESDSERNIVRHGPLLNRVVWYTIPVLARHVYMALGPDDKDLILISWNRVTGSVSVYYSPARQADVLFYQGKLAILRSYFETHGGEREVPYERADPSAEALILSNS
jgi:hypothetical protein